MSKLNKMDFPDNVSFHESAVDDFIKLDNSLRIPVFKAICKVAANPAPHPQGYGKPLSGRLNTYYKIKLRDYGVRIIYRLVPPESDNMNIIIIGLRHDNDVYNEAVKRIQ